MQKKSMPYLKIVLGSLAVATGIYYFWAPAQLAAGGISGLAIVIQYLIPRVPISFIVFGLDILMFLIGFIVLGASFGVKSVTSSISIALCMRLFERITPTVPVLSHDTLVILILVLYLFLLGRLLYLIRKLHQAERILLLKLFQNIHTLILPPAYSLQIWLSYF